MEVWRDIPGLEGVYQVSSIGNVKRIKTRSGKECDRPLKYWVLHSGYALYTLTYNGKRIRTCAHRLVALAFIPNPDNKPYVNHKDGNKLNNSVENLEWVTASENTVHAIKTGLISERDITERIAKNQHKVWRKVKRGDGVIFPNVKAAAESVGAKPQNVGGVCRGIKKTCRGYTWEYID